MSDSVPNFSGMNQAEAKPFFREAVKRLHPDTGIETTNEKYLVLLQRYRALPKSKALACVGFRALYLGHWWTITKIVGDRKKRKVVCMERKQTGRGKITHRIPVTQLDDVRCGPKFRYHMIHSTSRCNALAIPLWKRNALLRFVALLENVEYDRQSAH